MLGAATAAAPARRRDRAQELAALQPALWTPGEEDVGPLVVRGSQRDERAPDREPFRDG